MKQRNFKNHLGSFAKALTGTGFGYYLSRLASHPSSRVKKKIPSVRVKNIEVLPNLRLERKEKLYHVHHWFLLILLYILSVLKRKKLIGSKFINGVILGGILQGLTYRDRFRVRYPHKNDEKKVD